MRRTMDSRGRTCIYDRLCTYGLENYYGQFRRHGFYHVNDIGNVSMQDYALLGVVEMGDRQRLFRLVQRVKSDRRSGKLTHRCSCSEVSPRSSRSFSSRSSYDRERYNNTTRSNRRVSLPQRFRDGRSDILIENNITRQSKHVSYSPRSPRTSKQTHSTWNQVLSSESGKGPGRKLLSPDAEVSNYFSRNIAREHGCYHDNMTKFSSVSPNLKECKAPIPNPVEHLSVNQLYDTEMQLRKVSKENETNHDMNLNHKGSAFASVRQTLNKSKAQDVFTSESSPENKFNYGVPTISEDKMGRVAADSSDRIRVCARKRCLRPKEVNKGEVDIVGAASRTMLCVKEPKLTLDMQKYTQQHEFEFDEVFGEDCTNEFVYHKTVKPMIAGIFKRVNATCFAFGQTGSGKTYTILGGSSSPGLYLLASRDMFTLMSNGHHGNDLHLVISYYEIYNGHLFDLFNNRNRVNVREDGKQKVHISDLTERVVKSVAEVMGVVEHGNAVRKKGSTGGNQDSSRSHAVLQMEIRNSKNKRVGKLSLIDLAGSERAADISDSNRQTRQEGAEINQSLLALKECIRSIDQESKHTPFRQSKLTHILKDSFLGNSRTCMIANVCPSQSDCEHTLNTLRYAYRVRLLKQDSKARTKNSSSSSSHSFSKSIAFEIPVGKACETEGNLNEIDNNMNTESQPPSKTNNAQPKGKVPVELSTPLGSIFHPDVITCSSTPKSNRQSHHNSSARDLEKALSLGGDTPVRGHKLSMDKLDKSSAVNKVLFKAKAKGHSVNKTQGEERNMTHKDSSLQNSVEARDNRIQMLLPDDARTALSRDTKENPGNSHDKARTNTEKLNINPVTSNNSALTANIKVETSMSLKGEDPKSNLAKLSPSNSIDIVKHITNSPDAQASIQALVAKKQINKTKNDTVKETFCSKLEADMERQVEGAENPTLQAPVKSQPVNDALRDLSPTREEELSQWQKLCMHYSKVSKIRPEDHVQHHNVSGLLEYIDQFSPNEKCQNVSSISSVDGHIIAPSSTPRRSDQSHIHFPKYLHLQDTEFSMSKSPVRKEIFDISGVFASPKLTNVNTNTTSVDSKTLVTKTVSENQHQLHDLSSEGQLAKDVVKRLAMENDVNASNNSDNITLTSSQENSVEDFLIDMNNDLLRRKKTIGDFRDSTVDDADVSDNMSAVVDTEPTTVEYALSKQDSIENILLDCAKAYDSLPHNVSSHGEFYKAYKFAGFDVEAVNVYHEDEGHAPVSTNNSDNDNCQSKVASQTRSTAVKAPDQSSKKNCGILSSAKFRKGSKHHLRRSSCPELFHKATSTCSAEAMEGRKGNTIHWEAKTLSDMVDAHERHLSVLTSLCKQEMKLLIAVQSQQITMEDYKHKLNDVIQLQSESIEHFRMLISE